MASDDDMNAFMTALDKALKATTAADAGTPASIRKSRRAALMAASKHLANARNELDLAVKAAGK